MFDLGAFFFKHFEKILMVLFGTVLAFSIVLYGPWTYSRHFDRSIDEVAGIFTERPEVPPPNVTDVPDYLDRLDQAGVVAEAPPLGRPYFWQVLAREEGSTMVLPPSSVLAVGMRGYNRVNWEHNTNQPKAEGAFGFTGVEIQRATVIDGEMGEFEVLTRDRAVDYFVPKLLYINNAKHAPIVQQQEKQEQRAQSSVSGLTIRDLFNAVSDRRLKIGDVRRIVRAGVRKGTFTTQDYYKVNGILMELQMEAQDLRRMLREEGKGRARTVSLKELVREALVSRGYKGGGKWAALGAG